MIEKITVVCNIILVKTKIFFIIFAFCKYHGKLRNTNVKNKQWTKENYFII